MGRYYKRKKNRAVTCSYEEIIDFNTDGGSISVMGIHTPDDDTPRKMFPGLFQQFKHYKYLGCKVVGANAAQLPVDPMSVSYEAGEEVGATIDPRDVFDPILFHGCHGEDLGAVLNRLYTSGTVDEITASLNGFTESDDALDMGRPEILEGLYYKALTDRTWRKMPIQGGINLKGLHPLVYNLATNHYISPNVQGAEFYDPVNGDIEGFSIPDVISNATGVSIERDTRFFTPSLRRLGWMDTRLPYMAQGNDLPSGDPDGETAYADWMAKLKSTTNYARMPRIFMGVLLIPKSRRVKQFIRMRIVHYFKFAGFRGASMDVNMLGAPAFYEVGNDYTNAESNDDTILGGNPNEDGGGDDPTPTPPVPITEASVTAKFVNLSSSEITVDVAYNWNNNPDPYTATGSVSANGQRTFSAYTVPVGGKIGFKLSYQSDYQAEYTVTDASATVEVTCTRSASAPFTYTVTDNLSRTIYTFTEDEQK